MEFQVPDWLTKDFIKSALLSEINQLTINKIEVKRAVPKGTNFMCDIFRVKVFYESENNHNENEISLIVKAPILGGLNGMVFDFGLIQKEVKIYDTLIPMLRNIFKEDNMIPISYQSSRENVIVLEDLNFSGFKMEDRLTKLDFEHSEFSLMALAKFHAATVKLQEENPGLLEKIGKEALYRIDMKAKFEFMPQAQIDLHLIEISTWPELKEFISPLYKLRECIWDLLVTVFENNDDEFKVLNHGDFWVTNFLFKHNENNKPVDIKFLDFQLSRYTSPAADLIYFFHGSVQEDIRCKNYNQLLNIYLKSFNKHLKQFGCKVQTLEESELRKSLEKREFLEFYTNITLVPVVIHDPKESEVMEIKEMSEKDLKEDLANNPFRKYLQAKRYRKLFIERFKNEFINHKWFKKLCESCDNTC